MPEGWEFIGEGEIRDPELERILVEGPKLVSEIAKRLGMDPKTVRKYAVSGKWMRYRDFHAVDVTLKLP